MLSLAKKVELMLFGGVFVATWEKTMETTLAGPFCPLHGVEIAQH